MVKDVNLTYYRGHFALYTNYDHYVVQLKLILYVNYTSILKKRKCIDSVDESGENLTSL